MFAQMYFPQDDMNDNSKIRDEKVHSQKGTVTTYVFNVYTQSRMSFNLKDVPKGDIQTWYQINYYYGKPINKYNKGRKSFIVENFVQRETEIYL